MADPKACLLVSEDAVEEEVNVLTAGISPGRSTRSRAAAASETDESKKRPPPPLPGKRAQKRILFEQINDATPAPAPPAPPAPPPPPPPLPPLPPPPQRYVCDWAQAVVCNFPQLVPLMCQIDGCTTLVHHLCQSEWERKEGHPDTVARLCCIHHPEYKYKNQPEKAATPPSKKTPRTKPPAEVFPNPSPADSTITGAGQIVETPPAVNRK
jgi:hypothetical protein